MSSQRPTRRAAVLAMLGSVLLRPWQRMRGAVAIVAATAADSAQSQHDNREVLVRLYSPDDETLRSYLLKNRFEVLRYFPRSEPGSQATALALMPRSATLRARLPGRVNVEIVAQPPRSQAEIPKVGRGNRFADPTVRPHFNGKLIP